MAPRQGGAVGGKPAGAAASETPPLFRKLESADDDEREHGCLAIASLATEGGREMQELMQHGAIEALTLRLTDHMLRVRLAAVAAIRNMLSAGGGVVCSAMLSSGTVGMLIAQLQDSGPAGTAVATVAQAMENRNVMLDQLLVQVLLTLTMCCQTAAEAVDALTERPVLDACLAFLRLPDGDTAPARAPLVEMITLLLTLVEDNAAAVAYLTEPAADAPALVFVQLGQAPGAPALLQALCASTVMSLVKQHPANDPATPLCQAAEGWAWGALSSLAVEDSLSAFGTAIQQHASAQVVPTMLPAARAQLKSLEALTDAVFEEQSGAVTCGLPLLEALVPRCLAIPDHAANAAAAAAIAAAAESSVQPDAESDAAVAASMAAGATPDDGGAAAASACEAPAGSGTTLMQGGYLGFDNVALSMSELWALVRAVSDPLNKSMLLATYLKTINRLIGRRRYRLTPAVAQRTCWRTNRELPARSSRQSHAAQCGSRCWRPGSQLLRRLRPLASRIRRQRRRTRRLLRSSSQHVQGCLSHCCSVCRSSLHQSSRTMKKSPASCA